ncbi:MAG TPA: serine/threonine-protein kinase, partial [Kofleriaceae bacterium]|nr:serine/threonine-protein kinase [Kofleriaceae bacterium]
MGTEDATVAEPHARARVSAPSVVTTINSPLEALEKDEILRTRRFCLIGAFIGLIGGAAATTLPGDPVVTRVLLVGVGVALLGLLFLFLRTRDLEQFRKPSTNLAWIIPGTCATLAVPFFGSFSPVAVLLVLGIYFVGLGRSLALTLTLYAVCAGMQGVTGGLVIAGYHDTGLVHPTGLSIRDQIVIQGLVQAMLLATLITARMSRRATLLALGELEQAVRLAAHREALLLEAREELDRALRPGRGRFSEQVLGGYTLGEVLGRGAMGEVYEAQGPQGVVAIKVLSQASLSNPDHVVRFMRELHTAASIVSPHVARVIEVGEQPVPYLVMEKLEGQSLSEILRGKRSLGTAETLELAHQIGLGITAAAQAGVVHRDLKPQNVFRDRGVWKVLDFGVSRLIEQSDTLTRGAVVGTPTYMAPEQASGGVVDHSTDLYALAAILYRALTGQPPYAGGEVAETLYRVVHTRPRRPSEVAKLPAELDLVLAIGMARDPGHRFRTAGELVEAVRAALPGALPAAIVERGRALERAGAWLLAMPSPTGAMR